MQKFMLNGRWVSADVMREAARKRNQKKDVKNDSGSGNDTIEQLRLKYKELHPENNDVPVNKKNDKDWIESKIQEFTK